MMPILLSCSALHALPIGNPAEPALFTDGVFCLGADVYCDWTDRFSYRLGFYGDYVFNRNLEVKRSGETVSQAEIYTNAAYFALNFCNRVDLFGTLGTSEIDLSTIKGIFDPGSQFSSGVSSVTDFSWSVGARGVAWQCGCLSLGFEGQYFTTRPRTGLIYFDDGINIDYIGNTRMIYDEWQIGGGLAYRINIIECATAFVPYIGVKWAGCTLNMGDARDPSLNIILPNLESSRSWGYAVGATLVGAEQFGVTVEGRFGDEKAFYINGQARF